MTDRRLVTPAPEPVEAYAHRFAGLFAKLKQRNGLRRYLAGLLLPTERPKSLTGWAHTAPVVGAQHRHAQALQGVSARRPGRNVPAKPGAARSCCLIRCLPRPLKAL